MTGFGTWKQGNTCTVVHLHYYCCCSFREGSSRSIILPKKQGTNHVAVETCRRQSIPATTTPHFISTTTSAKNIHYKARIRYVLSNQRMTEEKISCKRPPSCKTVSLFSFHNLRHVARIATGKSIRNSVAVYVVRVRGASHQKSPTIYVVQLSGCRPQSKPCACLIC